MLAAVEFDDESGLAAAEVGKVGTNGKLSDELVAANLTAPNELPELVLGFGFATAKGASPRH